MNNDIQEWRSYDFDECALFLSHDGSKFLSKDTTGTASTVNTPPDTLPAVITRAICQAGNTASDCAARIASNMKVVASPAVIIPETAMRNPETPLKAATPMPAKNTMPKKV